MGWAVIGVSVLVVAAGGLLMLAQVLAQISHAVGA